MSSTVLEQDVELLVAGVQLLASDVSAAAQLSKLHGDSQFARRTYVRAVFALIEGNMNLMAGVVLSAAARGEIQLAKKELEIARQERILDDQAARPKFVPLGDRLAPLMSMFARCYSRTYSLDKSNRGWASFSESIEVRNRITHPKNAAAFAVTDSELVVLAKGREWLASSVEKLLLECTAPVH